MVEIPVMVTRAVINIQEDKIGAMEVAEWALDMTAVPTMDITAVPIMDMAAVGVVVVVVDAINLQEVDMVAAVQLGDPDLVTLVVGIGELLAMKVVLRTADTLAINIWE